MGGNKDSKKKKRKEQVPVAKSFKGKKPSGKKGK